MSPKYPRPIRKDPPQAGLFLLHPPPMPMFIEIQECSGQEGILPAFTFTDEAFLTTMGISLDLSRDLRARS